MRRAATHKFLALPVVLGTLLLRAAIPDGYMPAAAGSGLFVELCPTGMPVGFYQAVTGADSGHHHHHGSQDDARGLYASSQCPIGHLLSAAVAVDVPPLADVAPLPAEIPAVPELAPVFSYRSVPHSRDPPV